MPVEHVKKSTGLMRSIAGKTVGIELKDKYIEGVVVEYDRQFNMLAYTEGNSLYWVPFDQIVSFELQESIDNDKSNDYIISC